MAFTVKVTSKVTETRDSAYGPFEVTRLHYEYQGEPRSAQIGPKQIKQFPDLGTNLALVKSGDTIAMESTPITGSDGKVRKEISKIILNPDSNTPARKTSPSFTKKTEWKPDPEKDMGLQIGNALTNAATLLGAGKTVTQLEKTAWEIVQAGERLKTKLRDFRAGTLSVEDTKTAVSQEGQQAAHSYDELDCDVPF